MPAQALRAAHQVRQVVPDVVRRRRCFRRSEGRYQERPQREAQSEVAWEAWCEAPSHTLPHINNARVRESIRWFAFPMGSLFLQT